MKMESTKKINDSLEIILQYGGYDGLHHKQWVLDQVVRKLTGKKYAKWVKEHNGKIDSNGDTEYEWDVGIPP